MNSLPLRPQRTPGHETTLHFRKAARTLTWLTALILLVAGATGTALAAPASLSGGYAFFQWKPFLGPFHSVLLHFPIGFVAMAFLVDLYSLRHPSPESRKIVRLILFFAVVTSFFTIFFGLMRSGSAEYDSSVLASHKNYGVAVGALLLLTLVLHQFAFRESGSPRRALRGCFRVFLLASMVLISIAGHQGGNLTHGTNYLTRNAPQFVKEIIEDTSTASAESTATAETEGEHFFFEKVKPVLDLKCLGCHGPEKQKGGYRLDQKAVALKGGDSGKTAVKPGEPFESQLIRAVLLPPDDDDVMPPEGKKALTPDEIILLVRWVQRGAPFPETAQPATPADTGQ